MRQGIENQVISKLIQGWARYSSIIIR